MKVHLITVAAFAREKEISRARMLRLLRQHAAKHLVERGPRKSPLVNRTHLDRLIPALVDSRPTAAEDLAEVGRELKRLRARVDGQTMRNREFQARALAWFRRLGIPEAGQ